MAQLVFVRYWERIDFILDLLEASQAGLEAYLKGKPLQFSADCRLAFRELGLSLGLHAVEKLWELIPKKPDLFNKKQDLYSLIESLLQYVSLVQKIEGFWIEPKNSKNRTWTEHLDINMVMLATTLIPEGYLDF